MTSSIPPCKDIFGDLWTYLELRNRVSVCPISAITFDHVGQSHRLEVSLPPITQPGSYWLRTFLQDREDSPHFDRDRMISASQMNITVIAAAAAASETTFFLDDTTVEAGSLLDVILTARDLYGNPTTVANSTVWSPYLNLLERRRLSTSMDTTLVYLDGNDTRCTARPSTSNGSEFRVMIPLLLL